MDSTIGEQESRLIDFDYSQINPELLRLLEDL